MQVILIGNNIFFFFQRTGHEKAQVGAQDKLFSIKILCGFKLLKGPC